MYPKSKPWFTIITYQVITGNYNEDLERTLKEMIITYQVITGNYNKPERNEL